MDTILFRLSLDSAVASVELDKSLVYVEILTYRLLNKGTDVLTDVVNAVNELLKELLILNGADLGDELVEVSAGLLKMLCRSFNHKLDEVDKQLREGFLALLQIIVSELMLFWNMLFSN